MQTETIPWALQKIPGTPSQLYASCCVDQLPITVLGGVARPKDTCTHHAALASVISALHNKHAAS